MATKLNKIVEGDTSDNTLTGTDGPDRILGSFGDDTLVGKAGPDILDGQWDNNTLTGGPDNDPDWFQFDRVAGINTITDFEPKLDPPATGPGDRIVLLNAEQSDIDSIVKSATGEPGGGVAVLEYAANTLIRVVGFEPNEVSADWFMLG